MRDQPTRGHWLGAAPVRAARTSLVLVVVVIILGNVPHMIVKGRFLLHQSGFNRAVLDIQAGRIVPDEYGLVSLPHGYGFATSGANQVIARGQGDSLVVLFLTSRGAVGGFTGYAWAAADTFSDPDFTAEPIKAHWYAVDFR